MRSRYNKVIFLDIDGVLVNWNYTPEHEVGRLKRTFDPECLQLLEDFLREHTDVGIILSSTWRKTPEGRSDMRRQSPILAERHRASTGAILSSRSQEIADYLDNPRDQITHYVVLDDALIDPKLIPSEQVVRTNYHLGIQPHHIERMKEILDV